jgi:hypothetical protein
MGFCRLQGSPASLSPTSTSPSTTVRTWPPPLDWVRGFTCTNEVLKRLDPAAATRAIGRLREALAAHMSDDGVWFTSRAWIVTARRH